MIENSGMTDERALLWVLAHSISRDIAVHDHVAAAFAERDALRRSQCAIYQQLMIVAPWSESNDMDASDEIIVGIDHLAADRDRLTAEVLRLTDAVMESDARGVRLQAVVGSAYDAGWIQSAKWADRVDLIADIGSAAFERDKSAALSPATSTGSEDPR